jgi:malate dehydrogenase (oxaloacetate-decarboxylating)/malate dehydrogenase (oxaloacetate-decarboxylating)(NADP+)
LDDPLYHGWRHPRIRGEEHLKFVEEFVHSVIEVYGDTCLIQWEDFEMETAFKLLDYFRWKCNCFNDDIEGTAAVAAAAVATAPRIQGVPPLAQQKFLFIGAGSAATGIANLIVDIAHAQSKIPKQDLYKNVIMFDAGGMVTAARKDLYDFNVPYMHQIPAEPSVAAAVKNLGVTAVIGVSGVPGLITKEIVESLCKNVERPIVFALSNPTSKAECSAQQAYEWSDRKALFCSGSPFPDYTYGGKTLIPSQANNSWIFPAVGFALVSMKAKHCPPRAFEVSALALANLVKQEDLDQSSLLPPLNKIRDYAFDISLAVAKFLQEEGLATVQLAPGVSLEDYLKSEQFNPGNTYPSLY